MKQFTRAEIRLLLLTTSMYFCMNGAVQIKVFTTATTADDADYDAADDKYPIYF